MNSENTNVSLQAVLLTMMLEKIDNLSNSVNEMQIASGDIKEACDKLNDRIVAFEEKFEQVLQHQSSEPDQHTATPVETDDSKPADTKALFEDKPFSLASPQPAAPSPIKTEAQEIRYEEKENVSHDLNNSKILESQFFKKDDEWECQTCYVRNQLNDDNCISCGTSKDGKEETIPVPAFKPTTFSSANTSYSFGLNKSAQKSLLGTPPTVKPAIAAAPSSVKTKAQTDNSKSAETKRLFGNKPFSLASPQPAAPSPVKTQAQTIGSKPAGSLFGNKPFSFAPPPQPAVATSLFATQPKENPFDAKPATDESQPKSLFGGTGSSNANKTPLSFSSFASGNSFLDKKAADTPNDVFGARTSLIFTKQSATEENENPEEYVPDAHYEPVIPLPDKVDVVTGEESEEVLFKNRCKLYIFNSETKEIKERGIGDIKVLFNPENKSYRVVMRREQVHTICANFHITKGMNIDDKTETKGSFNCIDFSENSQEGTPTVFFIRFLNEKVYEEFKKLFIDIAEGNRENSTTAEPFSTSPTCFGVMFYDDKLDDVNKKGISRSDEQIDSSYLLAGDEAFVLFKSMYLLHSSYAYYRRLLKSNNFCFASIADVKDHPTIQSGNAMNLALRSLLPGFIHKKIKRIIVGTCEDKNIEKILECYMLEINEEVALYSPTNYVQKCHFMNKVLNDLRMACYVLPSLPRAHTPFLIFQTKEPPINPSLHFKYLKDVDFGVLLNCFKNLQIGSLKTAMGEMMMSICYKSDNTIQDTVVDDSADSSEESATE